MHQPFSYRKAKLARITPRRQSALLSFRFVTVAVLGSLAMAIITALTSLETQIGTLGALVSVLAGLVVSFVEQDAERGRSQADLFRQLSLPLNLAGDQEFYAHYLAFSEALNRLAMQPDPILRQIASLKAAAMQGEITSLADGTVVFTGTESWRTVYRTLLSSADVRKYRSVAWVRTEEYWQDVPGQQSMQANVEALDRNVLIERIVILADDLWPSERLLPLGPIGDWIQAQHDEGMWLLLIRESQLASEPELLADFGIYDERACGFQELDGHSHTTRFTLSFESQAIRLAEDRWRRLEIFAVPYAHLVDQLAGED